jgi:hypothetical protein
MEDNDYTFSAGSVSVKKVNYFEEILEEKNKLIEELKVYIIEMSNRHEKEIMEKDFKVTQFKLNRSMI